MYGYYSVGYWIYAANEYSLFDVRADVILKCKKNKTSYDAL